MLSSCVQELLFVCLFPRRLALLLLVLRLPLRLLLCLLGLVGFVLSLLLLLLLFLLLLRLLWRCLDARRVLVSRARAFGDINPQRVGDATQDP